MAFLAAIPALFAGSAGTLGTIGAGLSAVGTLAGGIAQGQEASYQAQIAQNNAQIAQQNALRATEAGQAKAETESLKGAAQEGAIKAAEAANGVDVNSGSNLDVQVGQRAENKLDTDTSLNNALLQSYGYRTQSQNYLSEASLDENKAEEAPIGAAIGATGSFLQNASSINLKWAGAQNNGSS